MASPSDRNTAVCLRSGVGLSFANLPEEVRTRYELPGGAISAIFMQLPNREGSHRDAIVFENGRTMLMNNLPLDLAATVEVSRAKGTYTTAVR
jgi:hypothetical protein